MNRLKYICLLCLLFVQSTLFCQMNFEDSTTQVITYWNLGDTYEYEVTLQNIKYTDTDTTSNETIFYDVVVTVIDSSADFYIVKWAYTDIKTDSPDELTQKLISISQDIEVDIKIDEMGVFQSVENWVEVRDFMAKGIDTMKNEFAIIPELESAFDQIKSMYSSKASIEAAAIQDAQQFHSFHGGLYALEDTINAKIKSTNLYDIDNPFDTYMTIILEELDSINNEFTIRSLYEVDSEQLTEATFNYLKEMTKNLGEDFIKKEDFVDLKNQVETVSRIHNSGWLLESILWKEVYADGITSMEIRTINMK